jgi:hypothetical protein
MSKTNRNPIDPLSIDAAEIMKYIQKQYFKFFETPPYETLGYTVLYNRILPAGARVVQRLGCMVGELPRLEGFMEPGLHGAIAQDENNVVCQDILDLFTIEGNAPFQWEFDITPKGVWEQIIYEIPWSIPLSGAVHKFPTKNEWLSANDSGAVREIDFSRLEEEMIILKDMDNGGQTTVSMGSDQVEQTVEVLKFWLKVEEHLRKMSAQWVISYRKFSQDERNVIVLSNHAFQPSMLDQGTLKYNKRMNANALIIKGDMFRLAGVLMNELIQVQEKC